MAINIKYAPVIFEVPRDISATDLKKMEAYLTSQFPSKEAICNEVPDIHKFTVEWNTDAIESAKKSILAVLSHWDGVRPKQFVIAFTNFSRDKLIDAISVKYSIENGNLSTSGIECSPEIYAILTAPDVQESLFRLTKKQELIPPSMAFIRCKPVNIHSILRTMDFKSFENNLDGPCTICKYDISKKTTAEAFCSASSIIEKMLLIQKQEQGPYKLSFTLPQNGSIKIRTTRVQGFLSIKFHRLGEADKEERSLLHAIKDQEFKISELSINGNVINDH